MPARQLSQRLSPPRPARNTLWVNPEERTRLWAIVVIVIAITVSLVLHPMPMPSAGFIPPVILAALFLPKGQVRWLYAVVVASCVVLAGAGILTIEGTAILAAVMVLMYVMAVSRAHHGVSIFAGDRMLVDLRESLRHMGEIPAMPPGWRAERAVATAHSQVFCGDFDIAVRDDESGCFHLVLVDVSGKGQDAGTRSVVLAGAFGGMVGSIPVEDVLPAANTFLERAHWDEGFATAVHLQVDLITGDYDIGHAGHPPAMTYQAGSGRWSAVTDALGPALGLVGEATYPRTQGRLGHGDALLVYTDGVIESRQYGLADGIDWMLGRAEASMSLGFGGLVQRLVAEGRAGASDDRAAIIIWRE